MMEKFTICCLLYGDNTRLAERLLRSLGRMGWNDFVEIRIGLNDVARRTHQVVHDFCNANPVTDLYIGDAPYYKYPLMRRMFHCEADASVVPIRKGAVVAEKHPRIDTMYTMWFDDDSAIHPDMQDGTGHAILEQLAYKMSSHDMVGAPYFMNLRGKQHQFIEDQPWYNGKPVKYRQKMSFVTGGWWNIWTRILQKHDWPPENFEHNGGDVMLGALCDQHGYKMGRFAKHFIINAGDSGKCSSAKRRGFSQTPIGVDYVRQAPPPPQPMLFDVLDGKHGT